MTDGGNQLVLHAVDFFTLGNVPLNRGDAQRLSSSRMLDHKRIDMHVDAVVRTAMTDGTFTFPATNFVNGRKGDTLEIRPRASGVKVRQMQVGNRLAAGESKQFPAGMVDELHLAIVG